MPVKLDVKGQRAPLTIGDFQTEFNHAALARDETDLIKKGEQENDVAKNSKKATRESVSLVWTCQVATRKRFHTCCRSFIIQQVAD